MVSKHCQSDEFCRTADAELSSRVRSMLFNCLDADFELGRNSLIRKPPGDKLDDLQFSAGQATDLLPCSVSPGLPVSVGHFFRI
jgi:hypothetical protein